MKRLATAAAVAGLMLLGLSAGTSSAVAADSADPFVTVKGHVRASSGHGIAGVMVKVRSKSRFASQYTYARTRTSATGRYEVRVPRTGGEYDSYHIFVSDPGERNDVSTDGTWAPAYRKVHTAAAPVIADVRMARGAGLSGRLTDAAGRPVKRGLAVTAEVRSSAVPLPQRVGVAHTTANGRYRFTNLPAGPTRLCFEAIKPTTYGRCYSGTPGGATYQQTALELQLISGGTLTGVDFEYPKVKAGIAGRVLLDGEPIDSDEHFAYVDLLDSTGKQLDVVTTFDAFAFRELDAGTYYLHIHGGGDLGEEVGSEYYRNAETLATATPIIVTSGQDVRGLLLDLTSD